MEADEATVHMSREVNRKNPVIPEADYLIIVGWRRKTNESQP